MSKKAKNWYAWHDARGNGGVFSTWKECEAQCKGKPGEKHMGFDTKEKAWAFAHPGTPMPDEEAKEAEKANAAPIPEVKTDPARYDGTREEDTAGTEEDAAPRHIDASGISHAEITEKVNRFCAAYGFEHLSRDQRRAVQTTEGRVLLFAVPGSGKTTVLIARTGYMIHACGIAPGAIVSLTFTKASAAEMRERYQKRFPDDEEIPEFRTIHSFAHSVIKPMLRKAGYPFPRHMINDTFSIQEETGEKKQSYTRIIFDEINRGLERIAKERKEKKTVKMQGRKDREALQTAITGIKNNRMAREQLRGKTIHLSSGSELPIDRAYDLYQELCEKYDCMDFDDMLSYALDGLKGHPEVLARLQRQYRYWSIDESQDNSPLQHDLLQLLAGENGNLFMVGDDDQSIYAFRGAKPKLFQQFGTRDDVTVLTMGTNYRSAFGIVKTAEAFIRENPSHQDKQMNAARDDTGRIRFIYDLHSERHQYEKIVDTARACREKGQELAILYRENISALPVIFRLEKSGIPFFTAAKLSEMLQSTYISRMLGLLRFALKQNSLSLYEKVKCDLHIFPGEDAASQWKKACKAAPERNVLEVLSEINGQDYSSALQALTEAAKAAPYDAIRKLIQEFAINPKSQSDRMQVNAILSVSELYGSIPEMLSAIEKMKKKLNDAGEEEDDGEAALPPSECEAQKGGSGAVTLTTMHSAKGLEFDHVMIIDYLAPPEIPYNSTQLTFDDAEEDRRLFYVAITRAKRSLDILTVQCFHGVVEEAHPFISRYASICDGEDLLTEYARTVPDAKDCAQVKVYGKYYGVRVGRVPGVYSNYDEAEKQIKGFSGNQYKSFPAWEEAAEYAYPKGIPENARPVDTSVFRQYLVTNPVLKVNWPRDIHPCVTKGILSLLHTDSLLSLSPPAREKLSISYLAPHADAYDYSGTRALAYAVSYLPPNYYKVWSPLMQLLDRKLLPYRAGVLELGAGPGTAGLALMDFYGKLAAANPRYQFSLEYTAVEREADFRETFDALTDKMIAELPANLHVSKKLIRADAFDFVKKAPAAAYDIVLESNMLNRDENITGAMLSALSEGLARCVKEQGHIILIEPGRQDQLPLLEKAVSHNMLGTIAGPEITSVDTSSITLVNQCLEAGIRKKAIREHWYSVIIAERKSL